MITNKKNKVESTFLNIELEKTINWKFVFKHIIFSFIWIFTIWILILRGDIFLLEKLNNNYKWLIKAIPFFYIIIVIMITIKLKWYYNLILFFYPILLFFWFLPKAILKKGKIYLFLGYINFIYNRFKRYKSTLAHFLLVLTSIFLLIIVGSNMIRVFSMIYFSFLYYKIIFKYIKQSFHPLQLFNADIEKSLDKLIKRPENTLSFLKPFVNNKNDGKKKIENVKNLVIANTFIEYLGANIDSYKGKRAFVISWIYQLIGFIVITVIYFTFINFELFIIEPSSYRITIEPSIFDFFYYSIKTFIFSNIESISPMNIIAKIIEILSFLTVGVFLLIIVTSVIFSLRQDRINENIKKASEVCKVQNAFIAEYIKENYQMDIETVISEVGTIKKSIDSIKKILDKIM